MRPNGHRPAVPAQCRGAPEPVELLRLRALDVVVLLPRAADAREDVQRAGFVGRGVVLLSVDALRRAVFVGRADSQRIAVTAQGEADAEPLLLDDVGCLEIPLLRPSRP